MKKEGGEKGDCEDKREIRLIRKVIEGYNFTFGEVKLVRIEGEHLWLVGLKGVSDEDVSRGMI